VGLFVVKVYSIRAGRLGLGQVGPAD